MARKIGNFIIILLLILLGIGKIAFGMMIYMRDSKILNDGVKYEAEITEMLTKEDHPTNEGKMRVVYKAGNKTCHTLEVKLKNDKVGDKIKISYDPKDVCTSFRIGSKIEFPIKDIFLGVLTIVVVIVLEVRVRKYSKKQESKLF